MVPLIIILIILFCIGSVSSDTSSNTDHYCKTNSKKKCPSRKEIKRMRKAAEKVELEAWEDMVMYMEVISDD